MFIRGEQPMDLTFMELQLSLTAKRQFMKTKKTTMKLSRENQTSMNPLLTSTMNVRILILLYMSEIGRRWVSPMRTRAQEGTEVDIMC